jgi:hypothetical protein
MSDRPEQRGESCESPPTGRRVSLCAARRSTSQLFSPSLSSLASRLCLASSVTWTAVAGGCGAKPCLPLPGEFEVAFVEFSVCCCFLASILRTSCTSASLMAMRVGFRRIMERCLRLSKVAVTAVVAACKTLRRSSQNRTKYPFFQTTTFHHERTNERLGTRNPTTT